jgi:streptomycin 6-kinase
LGILTFQKTNENKRKKKLIKWRKGGGDVRVVRDSVDIFFNSDLINI